MNTIKQYEKFIYKLQKFFFIFFLGVFVFFNVFFVNTSIYANVVFSRYGEFCNKKTMQILANKLFSNSVKIYFLGDKIYLRVPFSYIFAQNLPRIKDKSVYILDDIANFLRCYQKVFVKVSLDNYYYNSNSENYTLAQSQAKDVLDYLWAKHIGVRLISAVANKNLNTDANEKITMKERQNPKIVIETKVLP